jgi:hypothetical protein
LCEYRTLLVPNLSPLILFMYPWSIPSLLILPIFSLKKLFCKMEEGQMKLNTVCLPDPVPCSLLIWIRMDLHILGAGSGSALKSKGALGAQNGAVEGHRPSQWRRRGSKMELKRLLVTTLYIRSNQDLAC